MSIAEALERAAKAGYDLVEIAPGATPPVAKILDWGKYRYEQTKQVQKSRKNQRNQELKQVRLSLKIGTHDVEVKARKAHQFLVDGHKVKASLRFRGREVTHPDLGREVLMRFFAMIEDVAIIEQEAQLAGRELTMLLAVKKEVKNDAKTQDS